MPQRDADGNPVGGVRLPDIAVPLGVHGGRNAPLTTFTCSLVGAYQPFALKQASSEGRRPSLAERYVDQQDYVNKVRVAARAAEAEGFLLAEDAAVIVNAATENPVVDQKAQAVPPVRARDDRRRPQP